MRTTTCSNCEQTRSARIKVCPTCEDHATDDRRTYLRAAAIVPALAATLIFGADILPMPAPAEATPTASVWSTGTSFGEGSSCQETLACLGDRHHEAAMASCSDAIWTARGGDMKWNSGYGMPRFAEYGWIGGDRTAITYSGYSGITHDRQGRYSEFSYECDYDTAQGLVTAVRFF